MSEKRVWRTELASKSEEVPKSVGAVVHALRILRCLAAAPQDLGIASVARLAKVSPSTTFNIMRTLVREHILMFNEATKTYRIGPGILDIATGVLGLTEAEVIRPSIDNLALSVDMLIGLWRFTDDERMVLVDRAYAELPVRVEMPIGNRLPCWSGATGRALAAALDLSQSALRTAFLKVRWDAPPPFEVFLEEIEKARQLGYAVDDGAFYRGLTAVASIVRDAQGKPRFSVSGTALTSQLQSGTLERAGQLVRATAEEIAATLYRLPAAAHPHLGRDKHRR